MFIPKEALGNFCIAFSRGRFSVFRNTKPSELELELRRTSGERDQWVKEIACCQPTWPVLRLYYRCQCVDMCVCALQSEKWGKNEKIRQFCWVIISISLYPSFFNKLPLRQKQRFGTWWVASVIATKSCFFQSVHESPLSVESGLNALTFLP